ncbi:hypothetical protein Tco_1160931 [Tanacetum coccineum]
MFTCADYGLFKKDIISSKGPSKQLLKWYDDTTNEDIPEFRFSKLGVVKAKAKASKAYGSSASKNPPLTVIVKSPVLINNWTLGLENVETWDSIVKRNFGVRKPPTAGSGGDQ